MNIERAIAYYNKYDDELVGRINLDLIEFDMLKDIFHPDEHTDPLMYDCYKVGQIESMEINKYLEIKFDFSKYDYFVECYGI